MKERERTIENAEREREKRKRKRKKRDEQRKNQRVWDETKREKEKPYIKP